MTKAVTTHEQWTAPTRCLLMTTNCCFHKQNRNADYPPEEAFSSDHPDYESDNYIGFRRAAMGKIHGITRAELKLFPFPCYNPDMKEGISVRFLTCVISAAQAGQTVTTVLKRELRISNSLYKSLKWRDNAIRLNDCPVHVNAVIHAGDTLSVALAERRPPSPHIAPCPFPLDIIYEDADLLVLDKPALIPMHSKSSDSGAPTIAGALRAYLGPDTSPHFVNRLDRGTSGLCIAAKNGYIHDRLRAALHTGALRREYRAFAIGRVEPPRGVIELPIGPADGMFFRRCIRPDGLPSRTEYEVLEQNGLFAFLRLVPRTGRTHQLRVHMSAIGHPLAGDSLYGGETGGPISRPALHSCRLYFTHPITGEALRFAAPLPEDMAALLRRHA